MRQVSWSDTQITKLAKVGAGISKHLRHPWTGEQLGVSMSLNRLGSPHPRYALAALEALGLLALEDVADLNQVRFVRDGQHSWRQRDWEKAIRENVKREEKNDELHSRADRENPGLGQ